MKHLSPIRLSELADGLDASAPEAAHLRACPGCRGELEGLRALVQGLAPLPAPPKGLHQATLLRLGLSKPAPAAAWRNGWLWGPALAAGLAFALLLPRFVPAPAGPTPAPAAASWNPVPRPVARPLPHCAPAQAPAAPQPAAAPAGGSLASAPAVQAPLAVGAQAAAAPALAKLDVRGDDPGLKPTPGPGTLHVTAVRNNLLRPGGGDRFSLVLQLDQSGPLDASVLDERGRVQATLFHGSAGPGELELQWDGAAPSGAYTVLVQTRGESQRVSVLVVH